MKHLKTLAIILGAILGILFDTVWLTFAAILSIVVIPVVIVSLISTMAYIKIKGLK